MNRSRQATTSTRAASTPITATGNWKAEFEEAYRAVTGETVRVRRVSTSRGWYYIEGDSLVSPVPLKKFRPSQIMQMTQRLRENARRPEENTPEKSDPVR